MDTLGEKKYRARQIYDWLYKKNADSIDEMTNLAKPLRERLKELATIDPLEIGLIKESEDGTKKIQFVLKDGYTIESVLIPNDERQSLCVSSQVGCAMGCKFCYTGSLKLTRNLDSAEIIDQYRQALKLLPEGKTITNVVVMGMGEPLMNLENVAIAMNNIMDERAYNLSGRKVTVSTSGVVDRLPKLIEKTNVSVAVSLNATEDETRSKIMPINKKYPLEMLLSTLERFPKQKRARIVLEYVLLKGVNDTIKDAQRLSKIAKRLTCKVNLIRFNPHDAALFDAPTIEEVLAFQQELLANDVGVFIRQSRGQDVYGACGMLGKGE